MTARHADPEAERAVLGGALLATDALEQARALLAPQDFADARHRVLFRALLRLRDAGVTADLVTLRAELERSDELEAGGGRPYLGKLVDGLPRLASIESWAQIVREHARVRALRAQLERLRARLDDGEDADAVLAGLERVAVPGALAGGILDRRAVAKATWELIDSEVTGRLGGISTGLRALDDRLRFGGWRPGQLVYVGARTSRGKSALLVTGFAEAAAAAGHRVVVMSREMTPEDCQVRRLVAAARVSTRAMFAWGPAERERAIERLAGASAILERPLDFTAPGVRTLAALRAECVRAQAQGGLGVVVVDYLGLVEAPPDSAKSSSLYERTTVTSQGLKALAMDLGVPVLAAVQLNREPSASKGRFRETPRPTLAHFRDSGAIEQDADIALLIHQETTRDAIEDGPAELLLAKQRNGWTGSVRVRWDATCACFGDVAS